jgi:hypothetical protein
LKPASEKKKKKEEEEENKDNDAYIRKVTSLHVTFLVSKVAICGRVSLNYGMEVIWLIYKEKLCREHLKPTHYTGPSFSSPLDKVFQDVCADL